MPGFVFLWCVVCDYIIFFQSLGKKIGANLGVEYFFVPPRLFFSLPLSQVLKRIVMSLLTKVRYSTVTYSQSMVTTLDSWLRVFLCGFAMASAQIAITHLADGPPFHLVE